MKVFGTPSCSEVFTKMFAFVEMALNFPVGQRPRRNSTFRSPLCARFDGLPRATRLYSSKSSGSAPSASVPRDRGRGAGRFTGWQRATQSRSMDSCSGAANFVLREEQSCHRAEHASFAGRAAPDASVIASRASERRMPRSKRKPRNGFARRNPPSISASSAQTKTTLKADQRAQLAKKVKPGCPSINHDVVGPFRPQKAE